MNHAVVMSAALPITLFCIMLSMGTNLQLDDFRRVLRHPRSIAVGLISQMLLLPLIMLLLVWVMKPAAAIAVGFMVLSFSPGGATSNMFSYLARGNVALSISLTAVVSLVTPFTIPFLTNISIQWLMSENVAFTLPLLPAILKLCAVSIVPVLLGMTLRKLQPAFCLRHTKLIVRIPLAMLGLVILGIILQNWARMPELIAQTGILAMLLATAAIFSGYYFARALQLNTTTARTIGVETGIQNAGTAILVTGTLLNDPVMTIAPVMYGILMLIPTAGFILFNQNKLVEESL